MLRRPRRRRAFELQHILGSVSCPVRRIADAAGELVHGALAAKGRVALGRGGTHTVHSFHVWVGKREELVNVDRRVARLVGRHVEFKSERVAVAEHGVAVLVVNEGDGGEPRRHDGTE